MKYLSAVFLFLVLFPSLAEAQFATPLRVKNSGTIVTPTRYFLNCKGAGVSCVDDPAQLATDITVNAGAGGTLQSAYNNGGAGPQVIALDSTRLGISIQATSPTVSGNLFEVQGNATAATPTVGVLIDNTTAAANGAQQWSPFIALVGRGWETSGGTSQTVGWQIGTRPVQAATNTPDLVLYQQQSAGGGFVEQFSFSFNGTYAFIRSPNEIHIAPNGSTNALNIASSGIYPSGAFTSGLAAAPFATTYANAVVSGTGSALTITGTSTSISFLVGASTYVDMGASLSNAVAWGAGKSISFGSKIIAINTAPTITSGFGSSPSIATANGTASFQITIGNPTGASGILALPTATTGWVCMCTDITTQNATVSGCKQTASGTASATLANFTDLGVSGNWVAGDTLVVMCLAN